MLGYCFMCDICKQAGPPWNVADKTIKTEETLDRLFALGWELRGVRFENRVEPQLLCQDCRKKVRP